MVELVDMLDLGSSAVRRVGSTPSIRTKFASFTVLNVAAKKQTFFLSYSFTPLFSIWLTRFNLLVISYKFIFSLKLI